jgi:ATP synthase protein I
MKDDPPASGDDLGTKVEKKASRRLRARRERNRSVWFGLGMFGLIGWSIAVPVVAGIALGVWLDRHWPAPFSWTLTLLFVGLVLGCINAWRWIKREGQQ